jgi:DNA-binding response OmpR family regulator
MPRILIVEDSPDLAFGLRNSLEISGYEVLWADDGPSGLEAAVSGSPDLVILDLMLPGLDGYRVLRSLRDAGSLVPVLILTARGEEADKVMGFRLGADDYVTKPFGLLELMARVEALLRRASTRAAPSENGEEGERFGEVEVRRMARTVTRRGEGVELAPKEFDLLVALMEKKGQAVSRATLLKEVWGHRAAVMTRTVDTHVAELRRKLEDDPSRPRHITTVWKVGYRFIP